jgi:hypothetical protein
MIPTTIGDVANAWAPWSCSQAVRRLPLTTTIDH